MCEIILYEVMLEPESWGRRKLVSDMLQVSTKPNMLKTYLGGRRSPQTFDQRQAKHLCLHLF
jgi:hypothetical protein